MSIILSKSPFEDALIYKRSYHLNEYPQVSIPIAGKRYHCLYTISVATNVRHRRYFLQHLPERCGLFQLDYMLFNGNGNPFHHAGFQLFHRTIDGFKETCVLKKPKGFEDNFSRIMDLANL